MKNAEQFVGIESKLSEKLQVYQPNPQFVNQLRTRLVVQPGIEVETHRSKSRILLISAAFIGAASFLLWLVFYIASFFQEPESY